MGDDDLLGHVSKIKTWGWEEEREMDKLKDCKIVC